MKRTLSFLVLLLLTPAFAIADDPIRERIEWSDVWVTDADKENLPRVLLIGDSITRGYFGDVEKRLAGTAYCARLTTSKCVSDPSFCGEVELMLKQYKFAVIHFNNGLHGWGYSDSQYRDGLLNLLATFKQHAGDAKLIWANSTPIRKQGDLQQFSKQTPRIKDRNRIATDIMKDSGIPTNDLFELAEQHADWHGGDGVHFNADGKAAQAKQVAEHFEVALQ